MRLHQLFRLNEGGFALKEAGVKSINRDDIPATLTYISRITGIPENDLHPLGSVGKKEQSGDIDIAINVNKYSPEQTHDEMVNALGQENSTFNKGNNIGSYAVPIRGDEQNGRVQTDLMFTQKTDWAKFAYHSPDEEESKYKGAVRTILLRAVAAALQERGTDHFEYDKNGELIVRAGRTIDMNRGLRRIFQYRPKKKRGEGHVKQMKSISAEEFKQLFPDVQIKDGNIIIDDPRKVVTILFGSGVKPKDVETTEQVMDLIKSKFDQEKQDQIFDRARKALRDIEKKGIDIPPELS